MPGFRHLGDREVASLHRIRVAKGSFEAPDGSTFERDVIRDHSWVAVVPLLDDGRVLLVRQYRPAVDTEVVEIPAGLCDVEGEPPVDTAARELAEEAGKAAVGYELLAHIQNSVGVTDEHGWVFLATGLTDVPTDRQGVEEQHMTVETVSLDDVPGLVARGELTDAKTVVGLLAVCERRARGALGPADPPA